MKRAITSTLASVAVATTVAATTVVASAGSAAAGTNAGTLYASCEGTRIAASNIYATGGALLSTFEVYESGSYRSAKLCVRNVHRGAYYGQSMPTEVRINGTYDEGNYAYYAGAIRVDANGWESPHVVYGGANPEVDGRSYCLRSAGTTAGHTKVVWLCYSTDISR